MTYGIIGSMPIAIRKRMKRSFTLFEVIIVLVVIGILAAVITPRFKTNQLLNAANTFIETIRYTQHLAMIDDKYVPDTTLSSFSNSVQKTKDVKQWFKKWWAFIVWDYKGKSSSQYGRGPALAVFSDLPTPNSNNLFNRQPSNLKELARNPLTGKLICGHEFDNGYNGKIDPRLNLHKSYGIEKVTITTPCTTGKNMVLFDSMGRPQCVESKGSSNTIAFQHPIQSDITFTLCKDTSCQEHIKICLHHTTGFVHICK